MISFVHLSDIHFRSFSGDRYDVDNDLRHELLLDVEHYAKNYLYNVQGVMICGDIAFSGKKTEYDVAFNFLGELCNKLKVAKENVYCVPGNHDVDQDVPKKSVLVKTIQDELARAETINDFDSVLGKFCRDSKSSELLFSPIECYNTEFAGKYGCYMTPTNPGWEQDITLNEKYRLRIIGINSTIISNADDHRSKDERLMCLGQHQMPSREDDTICLTLCHHPPICWKDPEQNLQNKLNERVLIQLYGHKHLQTIEQIGNSLIIGSGATHPSRWEPDWIPRYNWITLDILNGEDTEYLDVKIYPRILNDAEDQFVADEKLCGDDIYSEFKLMLKPETRIKSNHATLTTNVSPVVENRTPLVSYKSLTYAFMNLAYVKRSGIITKLALDREGDDGLKHVEIIGALIKRAEEQGCVDQLWREILK